MFDFISLVSIVYIIQAAENLDIYCNKPHNLFLPSLVLNNFINVTVYCYCSYTKAINEEPAYSSFDFLVFNISFGEYNIGSDILY
jgi:hypothetical protein